MNNFGLTEGIEFAHLSKSVKNVWSCNPVVLGMGIGLLRSWTLMRMDAEGVSRLGWLNACIIPSLYTRCFTARQKGAANCLKKGCTLAHANFRLFSEQTVISWPCPGLG